MVPGSWLVPPPSLPAHLLASPSPPPPPRQQGSGVVIIDVNWRPVFWQDEAAAKAAIAEYIQQADILKVTDEVGCGTAGWRGVGLWGR